MINKFIVDREFWLRGEGSKDSCLLRSNDQKMCCFGFYALACGSTVVEIKEKTSLANIPNISDKLKRFNPDFFIELEIDDISNSTTARKAMGINDDPSTTDAEKEIALKEIFKQFDIELVFEN